MKAQEPTARELYAAAADQSDISSEFDEMVAGAQRRLSAAPRSAKDEVPLDPDAIVKLSRQQNPINRYFAGRDARGASVDCYWRKIDRTRGYLIEAGVDDRYAAVDLGSFPWHIVDESIATRFWEILHDRYTSHKSRENLLGILRRLLRECAAVGLISLARRDNVLECLPVRAGPKTKPGRALSVDELRRLISAAASCEGPLGFRNAAVIATFASTGLRRSELIEIDVADVDLSERQIRNIRIKGGASHEVWLHQTALDHMARWIEVRGRHDGALFDSSQNRGKALTGTALQNVVDKAAKAAGLAHLTTHDFRRTFITLCLREDVDVFSIARLVAHQRVTTTIQYDRRTDAEDRAIVEALPFDSLKKRDGR